MSDYELLSLYHDAISVLFTALTVVLTLLFSYLVAMFFIAHRLGIALFLLLNGLFVAVSFALSGALLANGQRAALIGEEIVARAARQGSAIDFLGGRLYVPPDLPNALTWFTWGAIALSVLYAVLHRRAQRRSRNQTGGFPGR